MAFIGIVLVLGGIIGIVLGTQGYGDIGLSFMYAGLMSIIAGIGFLVTNGKIKKLMK